MKNNLWIILLLFTITVFGGEWKWKPKAPFPSTPRHRGTGLSIGNKGYLGLGHINSGASGDYYDWWEYDPATNSWAQKANYPGVGRYGCASFVLNNKAYVGTGNAQGFGSQSDFYEYNPITNVWVQKANFPFNMDGGVGFTLNGKGYFGGTFAANTFMQYDPILNTWTASPFTVATSSEYGCAFVINNKAYFLAGNTTTFVELDPTTNTVNAKTNFPGLARFGAGATTMNGLGYVILGADPGYNDLPDSYFYNPNTNSWDTMIAFPGGKRHYTACFSLDNNKIFIGTGSNGTNLSDLWEFAYRPSNTSVGISEPLEGSLKIFPNPTSELLHYSFEKMNVTKLEIINIGGETIESFSNLNQNTGTINVSNLLTGIYFLRIYSNSHCQLVKFLKN